MEKKPLSSTFTTTSKKCWKSKLQHTHLKKKQKQPNNFILPCGKKLGRSCLQMFMAIPSNLMKQKL